MDYGGMVNETIPRSETRIDPSEDNGKTEARQSNMISTAYLTAKIALCQSVQQSPEEAITSQCPELVSKQAADTTEKEK